MKKIATVVTAGIAVLMIVAMGYLLLATGSLGSVMIQEKVSPFGFDKTVATIKENVKSNQWVIPKQYNFQKSLKKHGQKDVGRITVFKLCQPEIAGKMLARDGNKFVSVMMPCSVSVYEKGDGNTYVASLNVGVMGRLMGSEMSPIFKRVAKENGKILAFLN